MEKKSVFSKIMLSIIAISTLVLCIVTLYQTLSIVKEKDAAEAELIVLEEKLSIYEAEIVNNQVEITELEQQLEVLASAIDSFNEKQESSAPSTTVEYKAWVAAQYALEPYDLYDDLRVAYQQFSEEYDYGNEGTALYDASLKLLVPLGKRNDIDTYMKTLDRYFAPVDKYTARMNFIKDLVSNGLVTDNKNGTYRYYSNNLTVAIVSSKLNVTSDVADALLGLLRMVGWDV